MNAYYDHFNNQISNSRIIEGYFEEIAPRKTIWQQALEKAKAIATSRAVRRFAKPVSLSLSLFSLAGVIGAIESGRMGLFAGLLIGVLIIALQALAFRGIKKRS